MKPIIVGLHNPYSSKHEDALVPYPERSAGARLWRMMDGVKPIDKRLYTMSFDRRNLCVLVNPDRKIQRTYAKNQAHKIMQDMPIGATIILLGREVLDAFNDVLSKMLYPILIHPQVVDGVTWRWLPHPSGRVTQYNDPVMKTLAGMVLVDVLAAQENSNATQ